MAEEERKGPLRQVSHPSHHHQSQQQQQQPQIQNQQSIAQQQQSSSGATQGNPSDNIANWWPVFGRKSNGSSTTFWRKNPKKLTLEGLDASETEELENLKTKSRLNEDEQDEKENVQVAQTSTTGSEIHSMFVNLNRISKKTKATKTYLYGVRGSWLVYYKDQNDKEPFRACLKLCSDVVIEKKKLQGRSGDIHYIEFLKDGNVRKLFSENVAVVQRLYEAIRSKCVLQNFRESYKKLELLGSGSFAVVFKVQRVSDGQIFAAKIIKKAKLEENKYKDKFVAMLVNEYKVLSESHHKNVIKMEEIYQDHSQLVYIMEFLAGGEIYSRLRQVKHFTEDVAAEIMKNLTDGLYHIHIRKIVHRDLKLENVMFVNKTDNDCKLIDFGFAEQINYEKLESRAGTPGFLPPELFKLGPYTDKGDIFSLGVILYCLVSGCSPFKGKTYKDVLDNNRKCTITYDQPVWKNISEDCKHLIRRMVEIDPKRRYGCKEILKSHWIQKYYPSSPASQKSLGTIKTAKSKKNKSLRGSGLRNSLLDDEMKKSIGSRNTSKDSVEFNPSTMMNMHTDTPKSFYRKSMRSLKSIKSLKSHFSHKTVKSRSSNSQDEDDEDDDNSSNEDDDDLEAAYSQDINKTLSENYKGKNFENNVAKFKEDINNYCDIEDDPDEQSNLGNKIQTLLTPNKKFIHPLTQAASLKIRSK